MNSTAQSPTEISPTSNTEPVSNPNNQSYYPTDVPSLDNNYYLASDGRYYLTPNAQNLIDNLKIENQTIAQRYANLEKAFSSKVENWSPEQADAAAEKFRASKFGIPNDPSEYPDDNIDLSDFIKDDNQKKDFLNAVKAKAFQAGVPKDKLNSYISSLKEVVQEVNQATQDNFDNLKKQWDKDASKAWGNNADSNKSVIFSLMNLVPKIHPSGADAGNEAKELIEKTGILKNKAVAELFLSFSENYFPKGAKLPNQTSKAFPKSNPRGGGMSLR